MLKNIDLGKRFPALTHSDFRKLTSGQLISLTGSQMQHVGLIWQLYLFTKSPLSLGLLGLFRIVPILIFALWGGAVADALDRRKIMLASQVAMAFVSLTLAVTTITGVASAYTIYALAAVAGAAVAFDGPARQALIPSLLPREHLSNGLALYAVVWQIATITGPALGGLVLATWGVVPIYFLDVTSFLAVIAALLTMKTQTTSGASGRINFTAIIEGFRFIKSAPIIRSTMLLDFFATFFGGSILLMPIFADQILNVGPRGLGWLYAAQPVGAAITAIVLSYRRLPAAQGKTILWAVAAYGAAITVFGISRSLALSLFALAASGAADTVSMVIRQTARQLLTPDAFRGRMTSVNMIFYMGGPQLGEVEAGLVAKAFSARFSVASGGLLCIVATAIMALVSPDLRRYRA